MWLLLILGCHCNKNNNQKKILTEIAEETPATYLYNINIDTLSVFSETVRNGENVGEILNQYDVSFTDIDKVAKLSRKIFDLRDVKAGGIYSLIFSDSLKLNPLYFIYEINKVDFLVAKLHDTINVYLDKKELTIKEKTGSGIINSSLWYAMEESNLSAKLVNVLADEIYPWTIDFFRINPGDRFKVVYDAKYVDGEFIADILPCPPLDTLAKTPVGSLGKGGLARIKGWKRDVLSGKCETVWEGLNPLEIAGNYAPQPTVLVNTSAIAITSLTKIVQLLSSLLPYILKSPGVL